MFKQNCISCKKRIDKKFNYCPWCGSNVKLGKKEDYGMLGSNDEFEKDSLTGGFPFTGAGIGALITKLTRQISEELQNIDSEDKNGPKGFEIRFSTGIPNPNVQRPIRRSQIVKEEPITKEESERRRKLPIFPAKSKLRRLSEGITYEIDTPGVKLKKDISIIQTDNSIEVRAYSQDKCYLKSIQIRTEKVNYSVKNEKVIVQIKTE